MYMLVLPAPNLYGLSTYQYDHRLPASPVRRAYRISNIRPFLPQFVPLVMLVVAQRGCCLHVHGTSIASSAPVPKSPGPDSSSSKSPELISACREGEQLRISECWLTGSRASAVFFSMGLILPATNRRSSDQSNTHVPSNTTWGGEGGSSQAFTTYFLQL